MRILIDQLEIQIDVKNGEIVYTGEIIGHVGSVENVVRQENH